MQKSIDTLEVNRRADLLSLASGVTSLSSKPVASTGGGEYAGPCPFCGGKDRFRIEPHHQPEPRWMCRHCTDGKWKSPIEFGMRLWPGLKFPEVCERLTGGQLPTGPARVYEAPPMPAAAPAPEAWQQIGKAFVDACACELWSANGTRALDWLHKRGLKDETIKHFRLGYNPQDRRDKWTGEEIFIDRGITIPCFVRDALWYIKIRRPAGEPKYRLVKGSKPVAVFNADMLDTQPVGGGLALFVEGEFDCMLAWQELGDLLPVATLGAAKYKPDLATWGRFFLGQRVTLICYDLDGPGRQGAESLAELSRYAMLAPLPEGPWKDVTDFHQAGGDLRAWIGEYLGAYDPLELSDFLPMSDYAVKHLGATARMIPDTMTITIGDRVILS
jgi:DNA primase